MTGPVPVAELAALLPLSLAAGLDLYLSLAFLGIATRLGWPPPPGGLAALDAEGITAVAGLLYLCEVWIDRHPPVALFWSIVHSVVRPVAAGLLAVLLLQGAGTEWKAAGVLLASVLALAAHGIRVGWDVTFWLAGSPRRTRALASLASDVAALALLALLVDRPGAAGFLGLALVTLGALVARSWARAGVFAHRLVWARTWGVFSPPGWRGPEAFPAWLRRALPAGILGPGGPRGTPAGALGIPGTRSFLDGWLVVGGDAPLFVDRGGRPPVVLDPGIREGVRVVGGVLYHRVELQAPEASPILLYVAQDGPTPEGLMAEFQVGLGDTAMDPTNDDGGAADGRVANHAAVDL